jgi:hypothetical protein
MIYFYNHTNYRQYILSHLRKDTGCSRGLKKYGELCLWINSSI